MRTLVVIGLLFVTVLPGVRVVDSALGETAEIPCCGSSGCCGGPHGKPCRLSYGAAGTVIDQVTAAPIVGAQVRVLDLPVVTTAGDGSFSISGSRADTCNIDYYYSIAISADGYQPYQQTLYTSAVFPTLQVEMEPLVQQGFTVSGFVAEFPSCSGRMRGVTVTLNPLGRSTQTTIGPDGGLFAFENVPPGDFTLSVGPQCNPFGCWLTPDVTVVDHDEQVNICMLEELGLVEVNLSGETAAPGSLFEVTARLRPQGNPAYRVAQTVIFGDTLIQTRTDGNPDCDVSPEGGAELAAFELLPAGCRGSQCVELRATLESTDAPLTEGILYTCTAAMSSEPSENCEHELHCANMSATDAGGSPLEAICTDGTAVSAYSPSHLTFTFDIEPDRPRVGDSVTLTVGAALSGFGGLPTYSLGGAHPFFTGDTSPINRSQFSGDVAYQLVAAGGGSAALVMSVNYETVFGCPGNQIFQFTTDTSEPFIVDIDGPPAITPTFTATEVDAGATPTPTLTPCAFPTAPLCPIGQEPHCISKPPCIVGCGCRPCPACPEGQVFTGEINRCDCVAPPVNDVTVTPTANATLTPTASATPTPTATTTPCAPLPTPQCAIGEEPDCGSLSCVIACGCRPCLPCPSEQVFLGGNSCTCIHGDPAPPLTSSEGGCGIVTSRADSDSPLLILPFLFLAAVWRAKVAAGKRP